MAALPLTGEQYEITAGEVRAVVTEVGAGLRTFTSNGRPYVEPFPLDSRPPRGAGTVLVPWPNRTAGGRWTGRAPPSSSRSTSRPPATPSTACSATPSTSRRPGRGCDHPGGAGRAAARLAGAAGDPGPLRRGGRRAHRHPHRTNIGAGRRAVRRRCPPLRPGGDTATDDCTLQLAATTALPLEGGLPTGPAVPVEGDTDFRDGRPLKGVTLDDAFGGCVPAPGDELVRHRLLGPDGGVEVWAEPAFGWVQVFTPRRPTRSRPCRRRRADDLPARRAELRYRPDHDRAGESWQGSWGLRRSDCPV